MPKPPDGDRPTLDELVDLTKLSRRTIYYLLKVWQMVTDLGIPRDRLFLAMISRLDANSCRAACSSTRGSLHKVPTPLD